MSLEGGGLFRAGKVSSCPIGERRGELTRSTADGSDFDRRHAASDEEILAIVDCERRRGQREAGREPRPVELTRLHEGDAVGRLDHLSDILTSSEEHGLKGEEGSATE